MTENAVLQLQEAVDRRLGLHDLSTSQRFRSTGGVLPKSNKVLAEKALARYDEINLPRLLHEHKRLAGGSGVASDVAPPAIWERTVIREALYRLRALDLVDGNTQDFGASVSLPYSYRDTAAAGRNNTRTYEGQEINRAGVIQTAETAYPVPQKLAFEVTDEMRHLASGRSLNWDVVAENQNNASRIISEDTDRALFNEMLRASDEYGAVAVSNEDLEPQADGVKRVFVLAHFPVVRPRAIYDLQGNQVGSTVNAVTLTYNSNALEEYDGTGTQSAGTYYVLDYNEGEIYLVDESGAILIPANGTAYTISYSYATNVYAFDTDLGSDSADVHWDQFLYRYGLRKSVIEDDRYHIADFGLMSGTAMSSVEQAKQFGANFMVPGTDLQMTGDLGRIKDVPTYKVFGPGLWFKDQRVLIGQRGTTRYRLLKPWQMSGLENQRGPNGRFTGQKEAYGDQFIVIHTPTQLKRAYTSIVFYSSSGRVARVDP